jgi:hypothetical protein
LIGLLSKTRANYLELQDYHAWLVKEGREAVKKGRTMGMAEVRKRIAKLVVKRGTNKFVRLEPR